MPLSINRYIPTKCDRNYSNCCPYLINISQPLGNVLKCFPIGNIVHQHNAHGPSVVGGGDGVEPLLTGCVPVINQVTSQVLHKVELR